MAWKKGQSGNPSGRPPGAKDRRAALRALLEPHSEALINKAAALALEGDSHALRLCLERLVPPVRPKDDPVTVEGLSGDTSMVEQSQAIVAALAGGDITPREASTLMQTIATRGRIIETEELAARIEALERGKSNEHP